MGALAYSYALALMRLVFFKAFVGQKTWLNDVYPHCHLWCAKNDFFVRKNKHPHSLSISGFNFNDSFLKSSWLTLANQLVPLSVLSSPIPVRELCCTPVELPITRYSGTAFCFGFSFLIFFFLISEWCYLGLIVWMVLNWSSRLLGYNARFPFLVLCYSYFLLKFLLL